MNDHTAIPYRLPGDVRPSPAGAWGWACTCGDSIIATLAKSDATVLAGVHMESAVLGVLAASIPDVCPRCGNGRPNCRTRKPDGTRYTHAETCETYEWADDVCDTCQPALLADMEEEVTS